MRTSSCSARQSMADLAVASGRIVRGRTQGREGERGRAGEGEGEGGRGRQRGREREREDNSNLGAFPPSRAPDHCAAQGERNAPVSSRTPGDLPGTGALRRPQGCPRGSRRSGPDLRAPVGFEMRLTPPRHRDAYPTNAAGPRLSWGWGPTLVPAATQERERERESGGEKERERERMGEEERDHITHAHVCMYVCMYVCM